MAISPRRLALAVVAALLPLSAVVPAAGARTDNPAKPLVPPATDILVGLAPGNAPAVTTGQSLGGLPVKRVVPGHFAVVRAPGVAAARQALAGVPGITYVERDVEMRALATPNDTRYGEQYGPPMMGTPAAWDRGYGTASAVVAVIDSGIRRTHEDFTPASRFLTGRDHVNGDNDPNDDCGHGTHVIGTVAATTNNAKGVAGMAQATILPLKALGAVGGLLNVQCSGSTAGVAEAIIAAADQGAHIISMSIGGGASSTLENAVNYAWNKGVVLVAAAGNDGGSNSIDYPGAYANTIAVAALTNTKARASYSDGGPQLDIAAPGSNVLSTYNSSNTSYSSLSGTSMATPHVAGALALAKSCAPGATNVQLRDALYATAEDLGATGWDSSFGHGLARADRLTANLCGGGSPTNRAPTAAFTTTTSGLTASVNGSSSTDPDGDALSYAWTFGDGATATGVTASRTYAAAGTYTVTLTVNDGRGGTHSTSQSVTVTSGGGDPDPTTPNLTSGQSQTVSISAGAEKFYKINVPTGTGQLKVAMTGPACGLLSCSLDADLYTRAGSKPTDTAYACRPYTTGNAESCTHASPASGYWYVRIKGYSGSGNVTITATLT